MERDTTDIYLLLNIILQSYVEDHKNILKENEKACDLRAADVCERLKIELAESLVPGYLSPKYIEKCNNGYGYKATDFAKRFWKEGGVLNKNNIK